MTFFPQNSDYKFKSQIHCVAAVFTRENNFIFVSFLMETMRMTVISLWSDMSPGAKQTAKWLIIMCETKQILCNITTYLNESAASAMVLKF